MEKPLKTTLEKIKPGREGWIYLIHARGTNRYKVGRSVNPVVRYQTLQKQSPYPLTIIDCFWTIDAVHDESYIHKAYQENRTYGEWFEFNTPPKNLFWFARGAWSSDTKTILFEMHSKFLRDMCEQNELSKDDEEHDNKAPFSLLFHLYDYAENKTDLQLIDQVVHTTIPAKLKQEGLETPLLCFPPSIVEIIYNTRLQLTGYKEESDN